MNEDVLYNIMLNAKPDVLENLCLTNKKALEYCHSKHFWIEKLNNENLSLYIDRVTNKSDYKLLIKSIKDAENILIISEVEKNKTNED
jgi:hypothetical protein